MGNVESICSEQTIPTDKAIDRQMRRMTSHLRDNDVEKRAREVDFFVLDNSIRESTVGQLKGHTLENKHKIYAEAKKCGFTHLVVCAFAHTTRVDDYFVKELEQSGEIKKYKLYGFAEITSGVQDGRMLTKQIPLAMIKMKERSMNCPILEIDLNDLRVDWNGRFTIQDACNRVLELIKWAKKEMVAGGNIFINMRDFSIAMEKNPKRVLIFVNFIASLDLEYRPMGLIYEDATGKYLACQMGAWTKAVRKIMDSKGWKDGRLLVHVHEKWGYAGNVQLECIINGADGVWASVCEEGAALGHASSTVTIMNLVRMGNTKVVKKYNLNYLRQAAINVTKITTDAEPYQRQPICGARALDIVFDFGGIAGGSADDDFNVAEFFGEKPVTRITTLATPNLMVKRLKQVFGDEPQFTLQIGESMKKEMIKDLKQNRKQEYMSPAGLALLFDQAGGKLTGHMAEVIEDVKTNSAHADNLIEQVWKIWSEWDLREKDKGDKALEYDSFYHAFMEPYFGCFRCEDTRHGLDAIDMDDDGKVDWAEFCVYLKWAMHQYASEIKTVDQLLSVAFRKGILPAMRDETSKNRRSTKLYQYQKKGKNMMKEQ